MTSRDAKVWAIHRYPVKGLTPEPLPRTDLAVRQTVPFDRMYAIENGPSGFDPAKPGYLPKQRFLMLMRNARLAELRTAFDGANHSLTVRADNHEAARGDLRTPEGRAAIEAFFAEFCAGELRGPPKVLRAEGHSFSDVSRKVISIINLASVAALEEAAGAPVDPLRFRGNLHVEGWPAWHEFGLLNSEISVGPAARLKVVKRIVRCAATEVDPDTGIRDIEVPRLLMKTYDHMDCGVYAEVIEGGAIAVGDSVRTRSGEPPSPGG
ncbi:MAG: MOSC domain-containing protein [Hyphomicrobiales bacterium]